MTFFKYIGNTIHYKFTRGKGERNFLFINSLGTDFRIWDEVAGELQDYGNLIFFDKRGHGLSEASDETRGLKSYMEDVQALLHFLAVERCTPVGISVGGMIAQLFSHHFPGMVEQLILCDTRHKIADQAFWNTRIQKIKNDGLKSISADLMKRWFPPSFHKRSPEKVTGYRTMLERTDLKGYVQTCEAIRDADLTDIAGQISHRTICIVGSEDLSTTVEEVMALSRLIKSSEFAIIDDSGHLPCADKPVELSKLIIDFIKKG